MKAESFILHAVNRQTPEKPPVYRTEIVAGVTTFLTMAYIIFVQPAILSTDVAGRPAGLDFGAVLLVW